MSQAQTESLNEPDLDEVLWQVWKAMELPEGYHVEIIDGALEGSCTTRRSHMQIVNRVRRALDGFLDGGECACHQDVHVIHNRKAWIPDAFVAPEDTESCGDEDDMGVKADSVQLVIEVVSPGKRNQDRDRVRKRREYARAGIPVYVIIDDHDNSGTVSILTAPLPERARYEDEHRVPYGTDALVPEGPAKGFVIGEDITGPKRT